MKEMASETGVSSPAATGGAGTVFEQHVNAYWLAHLLVAAIPPILRDSTVSEVYFQTEHLGWNTDDFLLVCVTGAGNRRKLAGQVQRSFTVSATDPECKKAIEDSWTDLKSTERFLVGSDRLALVIRRRTNVLLEDFGGLLDCARAAQDSSDFKHRLATLGFMTANAIHYCGEIRKIVAEVEGRDLTPGELWPFLRVLHVLSLDLNTSTGRLDTPRRLSRRFWDKRRKIPIQPKVRRTVGIRSLRLRAESGRQSIVRPDLARAERKPLLLGNVSKRVVIPALRRCALCGKRKSGHQAEHDFKLDESLPTWHGWYSLRRGVATTLAGLTKDGMASKGLLRHTNLATTTRHYVKDVPENTQNAMNRLEALCNERATGSTARVN